jgi:hypothetical protein
MDKRASELVFPKQQRYMEWVKSNLHFLDFGQAHSAILQGANSIALNF